MASKNSLSKPLEPFSNIFSTKATVMFLIVTFAIIVSASSSSLMFPFPPPHHRNLVHLPPRSSQRALGDNFDVYTSFLPYNHDVQRPQYYQLSHSSHNNNQYYYHHPNTQQIQGEHHSHISSYPPLNIPIHRRKVYVFHDDNDNDDTNVRSKEIHHRKHSTPFRHEHHDHFDYFHQPREKTHFRQVFIHEGGGCLGGRLERLYETTGLCYTLGTHGPCGPNMIFQSLPNNNKTHGTCGCDDDSFDRPLVQFKNKCHFLYTQAHCAAGKWLSVDEEGIPHCETNPCSNKVGNGKKESSFVFFHGKCVELKSKSKYCSSKQVVGFVRGKFHPTCAEGRSHSVSSRRVNRQIAKVGSLKCSYGKKYNKLLKKCVKMFAFRMN